MAKPKHAIYLIATINAAVTVFLADLLLLLLVGLRAHGWVIITTWYDPVNLQLYWIVAGYEEPTVLIFEIPALMGLIVATNCSSTYLIRVLSSASPL